MEIIIILLLIVWAIKRSTEVLMWELGQKIMDRRERQRADRFTKAAKMD